MAKTFRKPRSGATFRTLTQFAAALQSPITTVSGWTRHDLWKWPRKGPWSREILPDVLRWAADNLEQGRPRREPDKEVKPGSTKDLRDQKLRQEIRKLRANADQAETALAKERASLHDAGDCRASQNAKMILVRNAIQNLPPQIVPLALSHGMQHDGAPAFQKQIEDLTAGALRFLSATTISRPMDSGDRVDEDAVSA